MRIDRILVEGFGRLRDLDTGPAALDGLVVVVGPNEAGKSTLFTFLTTALYGFQPAARERNPHVPWGAAEAAGRIRIQLDAGGCGEVERRLRSQPSGRLTLDGASSELRNQPLPWVEHVPRTVFRQVFAVTLGELADLDSETWARIHDKLVGTMGASDLGSARSVADTLEREAGEIWRPNRRGNQRLRALQAEGRALRTRRAAALDRDAKVRAMTEKREQAERRLEAAREQRQRDRLSIERTQTLRPLTKTLARIAALREAGGSRDVLRGLPADPPGRLDALEAERARLERQDSALEAELLQRKADVAAFDDRERMILQHRDDIVRLFGRSAACGADRARTAGLETEIGGLEVELDEVAGEILEGSWRDVSAASVEAIPIELLRSRVGQLHASSPRARRPEPPRSMDAVLVAALLAGIALLAWGLASGGLVPTAFGAGASAVALTLGIAARRSRMSDASFAGGPAGESARSEVLSLLARLPIQANHLDEPREGLVTELARLQALLGDRGRCTRALESALRRIRELDDEAARLGRTLRLPHAREAEGTAHALDLDLRKAERLQDVAETAARELRRLARGRDDVAVVLAEMAPELQALRGLGERLAPGNARAGLELAKDRLDAHRRADELEEELERNHPNLDELRARLRADEASGATTSEELGDERLARTRARVEALEEEIEQLVKACESLARDAEHLRELETVDVVDSEIASLREAEARLARERDRKWVLAKLLRQADRRFREEHQPDLLRRASSYLSHLTGGRYERLVVDERPEADLFQVVGPGLPAPVPLAPPVSTGTLEQAYLSLRFAIVDHLDQGGEKLPLFIDEVFVNWDRRRRARGLEVLAGISSQRQVFVFTCHRELAEELRAHGGRVLSLEPVV